MATTKEQLDEAKELLEKVLKQGVIPQNENRSHITLTKNIRHFLRGKGR